MSALKRPKRDNTKTVSFSDEEDADGDPSVDRIVACSDNHTTCVNDKIDALKEVLDENTCRALASVRSAKMCSSSVSSTPS